MSSFATLWKNETQMKYPEKKTHKNVQCTKSPIVAYHFEKATQSDILIEKKHWARIEERFAFGIA